MRRLLIAALLSICAITPVRAQYSGPGGSGLQVAQPLIDRSLLDQLLHAKRPELLFRTDDVIAVQAYDVLPFNFQQRVAEDGTILAPLIGRVTVSGLTIEQVQALLTRVLAEKDMIQDANLTVTAVSRPAAVATVSGAVAKPGVFPAIGDLTISGALSLAGGLNGSSGASVGPPASSTVTLVRPSSPKPINIPLGPEANSTPYGRIPVFPGDEIRVGKLGMIYTVGAFRTQGAITLKDTSATTVLNVVSMAGGIGYQAKENQAYIIRVTDGEKIVLPVSLKAILAGKAPDMAMQDQDILMLPTSQIKAAIKGGGAALIVSVASAFIYSGTL
jgi:polysaccharide export outer membrane protein